jgi:hypothetical protein
LGKGMAFFESFLEEGKNIKDYASKSAREKDMELGPFKFTVPKDLIEREVKPMQLVEGYARYEGEWSLNEG